MEQSNDSRPSSGLPPRSRLGKGIGALLGGGRPEALQQPAAHSLMDTTELNATAMLRLPVDRVSANPFQPRRVFDEAALGALAASLSANGLIQPIVVLAVEDGYQLVAGERRLRAAKLAGLTHIPAIVRKLDAAAQARLALIENIHREDLNPMDRAEGYRALMETGNLTQQALADTIGDQRTTIANHMRLLELPEPIQEFIRTAKLSLGHAKVIAGFPVDRQLPLAERCVVEQWSVRQLESANATFSPAATPAAMVAAPKPASLHYQDLSQQLTRALGVRAQVQPAAKKGSGKVTLHYSSLDEFDRLLLQLGIKLSD